MKTYLEFIALHIKSLGEARIRNLYGRGLESTRYLYHGSNRSDLHKKGIHPHRVDKSRGQEDHEEYHAPQKRSYFTPHREEAAEYGKHVYRIDTHHPNMAKHVFHNNYNGPTGELVTRQRVPPGEHLTKNPKE